MITKCNTCGLHDATVVPSNRSNKVLQVAILPWLEASHQWIHRRAMQSQAKSLKHPHSKPSMEHPIKYLQKDRLPGPTNLLQTPPEPFTKALPDRKLVATKKSLSHRVILASSKQVDSIRSLNWWSREKMDGVKCGAWQTELHHWTNSSCWHGEKTEHGGEWYECLRIIIYQLLRDHRRKMWSVVEPTLIKMKWLVPIVTPKLHPL